LQNTSTTVPENVSAEATPGKAAANRKKNRNDRDAVIRADFIGSIIARAQGFDLAESM
jgi:hypothetical protein